MSIAILTGNGVSVADNPNMETGKLARALVDRFSAGANSDSWNELQGLTEGGSSFEELLGPLDVAATGIAASSSLVSLISESILKKEELDGPLQAEGHLRKVYNSGVAITLEEIQRRAKNSQCTAGLVNGVWRLAKKNGEKCYFGTLNYDGLVYDSIIEDSWEGKCDLADGRSKVEGALWKGAGLIEGWTLRGVGDFPTDRDFIYLQLHGSVGWLQCPGCSMVARFPAGALQKLGCWDKVAVQECSWQPQVILTSRFEKLNRMRVFPFGLAFDVFNRGVSRSRSFLVAGYGFGDIGVNDIISNSLRSGSNVLVMMVESGPSRKNILRSLHFDEDAPRAHGLILCRCGLPESLSCDHWGEWENLHIFGR